MSSRQSTRLLIGLYWADSCTNNNTGFVRLITFQMLVGYVNTQNFNYFNDDDDDDDE